MPNFIPLLRTYAVSARTAEALPNGPAGVIRPSAPLPVGSAFFADQQSSCAGAVSGRGGAAAKGRGNGGAPAAGSGAPGKCSRSGCYFWYEITKDQIDASLAAMANTALTGQRRLSAHVKAVATAWLK